MPYQPGKVAVTLLRPAKWVLFLLGSAVALSPAALTIAAGRAERRLEQAVQEMARRGDPVDASQLTNPPLPDSENAALIYQQAFDAIDLPEEDAGLIADLGEGRVNLDRPETLLQAQQILARNAKALELIHRAAGMARCDFQVDWSRGFYTELPHLSRLRTCARLLAFESLMRLDAGRADEAADVCRAIFRVANAPDDTSLIELFVRYAIIGMGSRALQTVLLESQPAAETSRELASDIGRIDLQPSFLQALKGDRALGRGAFAAVRSGKDPLDSLQALQSGTGYESSGPSESGRPERSARHGHMMRWVLASDEMAFLQRMAQAIEYAPRPYREQRQALDELSDIEATYLSPHRILTCILIPAFDRAFALRDRATADLALAEIALLLKAYRGERGAYPESLADLEGFVEGGLPDDPFSGKQFAYRREGEGFLLYSWGANLQDDGGSPPPPERAEDGDIILRSLR